MARTSLDQVIDLIERLDFDELQQVQQVVQRRLDADSKAAAMERFHKALLASGMVKEIKRPSTRPAWDRPPIKIQGEPLSETIIRERR